MGHPVRAESLKVGQEIRIPARPGAGLRVAGGEYVQIVDVEGRGCADLFALAAENPAEYLSASHTRSRSWTAGSCSRRGFSNGTPRPTTTRRISWPGF
jgi:uncharacterized protein